MFKTLAVANRILDEAEKLKIEVSPMKLQKLIYFSHGWWLAIKREALIDEPVEAWRYGPVINSVYHEFKSFGNAPIVSRATEFDTEKFDFKLVEPVRDHDFDRLVTEIFRVYGKRSAIELSEMTHADETPWSKVVAAGKTEKNSTIPNEMILGHFSDLLTKAKQKAADKPAKHLDNP